MFCYCTFLPSCYQVGKVVAPAPGGANYGSKGFSDWLPECSMVPLTSRRNPLLGVSGKEV